MQHPLLVPIHSHCICGDYIMLCWLALLCLCKPWTKTIDDSVRGKLGSLILPPNDSFQTGDSNCLVHDLCGVSEHLHIETHLAWLWVASLSISLLPTNGTGHTVSTQTGGWVNVHPGKEGSQYLLRAPHTLAGRKLVWGSTLTDLGSNPDYSTSYVTLCTSLTSLGLSIFIYKVDLLTLTGQSVVRVKLNKKHRLLSRMLGTQ